jgi:hypothetical protein
MRELLEEERLWRTQSASIAIAQLAASLFVTRRASGKFAAQ